MNSFARIEGIGSGISSTRGVANAWANAPRPWPRREHALQHGLPLALRDGQPEKAVASRQRGVQLALKRTFDVVAASLGLLALLPLLTLVAVAIKATSPGPILFRQQREGRDGTLFAALKFRSMRVEDGDDSGILQTRKNDPRVTDIGRFLRKTSIDELPQLLNVIMGDMSLVGPRPHVPGMWAGGMPYRQLVPYYDARLAMRPGITGWAQANGLRGPTVDAASAIARIDHDAAYIQNFSVWLDIRILFRTIRHEFLGGSGE